MNNIEQHIIQTADSSFIKKLGFAVGFSGLIVSTFGLFNNADQFFHSYLVAFLFWLSIGLGALFFTLINNISGSIWNIVLRRIYETIMAVLPVFIVLFLPLLFGIPNLFNWSNPEVVAADVLLSGKSAFLNVPFFIIRSGIYLFSWAILSRKLYQLSIKQDNGSTTIIHRLKRISAPSIFLFALTVSFAAFDWIMALDANWYSTIFGVYFFSGSFVAALTSLTIIIFYIQKKGYLTDLITTEHYHDLGRFVFGFVVFWAYIAGSQYFLIWYGNIPEETVWFLHRWEGSWKIFSMFLILIHLVIPFLVLIFRAAKRNPLILVIISLLILIGHYADLYWQVMPNLHHHNVHLSWLDLSTMVGLGGICIGLFWGKIGRAKLVPINDPRLSESINIGNG